MKRIIIASLVLAAATISTTSEAKVNWTKHGAAKGVTVYTSTVNGSDVPRVKAVSVINASPDDVWAYITGPQFKVKGLKVKKKLGSCGADCDYTYFRVSYPLVDDRHYVLKTTSTVTDKNDIRSYKRTWQSVSSKVPHDDDAVVVEKMSGSWTLQPLDGGTKTKLTYTNHMDIAGSIPASLFGSGFVDKAYEVLARIRNNAGRA